MKHHLALLVLFGLVPAIGLRMAPSTAHMRQAQVYTVDEVQTFLARDPEVWVGRTVLVRGVAEACLSSGSPARFLYCHHRPQDLFDPGLIGTSESLPLVKGTQSSWLALLYQLPLVGRLLPPRQAVHWWDVATYRVQLRAAPAGSCLSPPCYEVLLLDTAPDSR